MNKTVDEWVSRVSIRSRLFEAGEPDTSSDSVSDPGFNPLPPL